MMRKMQWNGKLNPPWNTATRFFTFKMQNVTTWERNQSRINFCHHADTVHKMLVKHIVSHKSCIAQAVAHGFIQEQIVYHNKPSYQMTRNHNCLLIPLFHWSLNT